MSVLLNNEFLPYKLHIHLIFYLGQYTQLFLFLSLTHRTFSSHIIDEHSVLTQALNGDILGDNVVEDLTIPAHVNKLPFVTWPALRAVLVDKQTDDDKGLVSDPHSRSSSIANRSLSPIAENWQDREKRSEGSKTSNPHMAYDQTSTRSEEERNRVSLGSNRLTPESEQSDEARRRKRKFRKLSAVGTSTAAALATGAGSPAESQETPHSSQMPGFRDESTSAHDLDPDCRCRVDKLPKYFVENLISFHLIQFWFNLHSIFWSNLIYSICIWCILNNS